MTTRLPRCIEYDDDGVVWVIDLLKARTKHVRSAVRRKPRRTDLAKLLAFMQEHHAGDEETFAQVIERTSGKSFEALAAEQREVRP